MKFEVVGTDKKVKMSTRDTSAVYPLEELLTMEGEGLKFRINRRVVKAADVHATIAADVSEFENTQSDARDTSEDITTETSVPASEVVGEVVPTVETEPEVIETESTAAPVEGKFTVRWNLCKRVKQYDNPDAKSKEFDNLDDAVTFMNDRAKKVTDKYWAGGWVEDENGARVSELPV